MERLRSYSGYHMRPLATLEQDGYMYFCSGFSGEPICYFRLLDTLKTGHHRPGGSHPEDIALDVSSTDLDEQSGRKELTRLWEAAVATHTRTVLMTQAARDVFRPTMRLLLRVCWIGEAEKSTPSYSVFYCYPFHCIACTSVVLVVEARR